jgi:mannose-6-phosphate isomerase
VRPVVLPQNAVPRFYRGGAAIAALRGIETAARRTPEDWVGSTTTVFGEQELGLSRLPDGRLLRDAVAPDPLAFFGPDHVAQRGADPCLLVKLLDAGEQLPVHVHPDDALAGELLGSRYGKTEAWIVIETDGPAAAVHLGFREDVSAATLERWVREQDAPAMLDALNPVEVRAGDALFVPAGTPHAIGEGLLIVELQEPSDLSILLEWHGFADGEGEASLGLGWDVALGSVERSASDPDRLRGRGREGTNGVSPLLPAEADRFFCAERIEGSPTAKLDRGFAILVFTEGAAELHSEDGEPLPVRRGDTVLLPWGAGACRLDGEAVGVACRPPAADAESPT